MLTHQVHHHKILMVIWVHNLISISGIFGNNTFIYLYKKCQQLGCETVLRCYLKWPNAISQLSIKYFLSFLSKFSIWMCHHHPWNMLCSDQRRHSSITQKGFSKEAHVHSSSVNNQRLVTFATVEKYLLTLWLIISHIKLVGLKLSKMEMLPNFQRKWFFFFLLQRCAFWEPFYFCLIKFRDTMCLQE